MSKLEFDLDRQERPVSIGGEDYVLVELDGKQRDRFLNDMGSRTKVGKDGKSIGRMNFDGMQAGLIAASLRKVEADGSRTPVTPMVIQAWPARISSALFDEAQDLSGLSTKGEKEEDEGND